MIHLPDLQHFYFFFFFFFFFVFFFSSLFASQRETITSALI